MYPVNHLPLHDVPFVYLVPRLFRTNSGTFWESPAMIASKYFKLI